MRNASASAADPGCLVRRASAQDGHAPGNERHPLSAAHRLPVDYFSGQADRIYDFEDADTIYIDNATSYTTWWNTSANG
jgi:hypothetical protein